MAQTFRFPALCIYKKASWSRKKHYFYVAFQIFVIVAVTTMQHFTTTSGAAVSRRLNRLKFNFRMEIESCNDYRQNILLISTVFNI
jgi:hypothetical protein